MLEKVQENWKMPRKTGFEECDGPRTSVGVTAPQPRCLTAWGQHHPQRRPGPLSLATLLCHLFFTPFHHDQPRSTLSTLMRAKERWAEWTTPCLSPMAAPHRSPCNARLRPEPHGHTFTIPKPSPIPFFQGKNSVGTHTHTHHPPSAIFYHLQNPLCFRVAVGKAAQGQGRHPPACPLVPPCPPHPTRGWG